jgi:ATP-binding cassette, subfamily B, bacterial PglK
MKALSNVGDELTVLIIAHRLSTLTGCDFIVKLEHGRIVDQGPPAQMLGQQRASDSAISDLASAERDL